MGYLHSWEGYLDITPALIDDVKRIIETSGVKIAGPDGTGEPILLVDDRIEFNGSRELDEDYEPICLRQFGLNGPQGAKTGERPYDDVACAVLLRIHDQSPKFKVESDGGFFDKWAPGVALYAEVFGEEPAKPEGLKSFDDEDDLDYEYGIEDEYHETYDEADSDAEAVTDKEDSDTVTAEPFEVSQEMLDLMDEILRTTLAEDDNDEIEVTYPTEDDFNEKYTVADDEEDDEEEEEHEQPSDAEIAKVRDRYERLFHLYKAVTALSAMNDISNLISTMPEKWRPLFGSYLRDGTGNLASAQTAVTAAEDDWQAEAAASTPEQDYDEDEELEDATPAEAASTDLAETKPQPDDFDQLYGLFLALADLSEAGAPADLIEAWPPARRAQLVKDLPAAAHTLTWVQQAFNKI